MSQKAPISYNTKSYSGEKNVVLYFIDFAMSSKLEIIKENNDSVHIAAHPYP